VILWVYRDCTGRNFWFRPVFRSEMRETEE
jgi:hypothetical protein